MPRRPHRPQHEQHRRGGDRHVGSAAEPLHPAVRHAEREPGQKQRVREADHQERGQRGPARGRDQAITSAPSPATRNSRTTGDPAFARDTRARRISWSVSGPSCPRRRRTRASTQARFGERHGARTVRSCAVAGEQRNRASRLTAPGSHGPHERSVTLTPQTDGAARGLHVEAEVHAVAVLDDVLLALDAQQALLAARRPRSPARIRSFQPITSALMKPRSKSVWMTPGGLRRLRALVEGPGAALLLARR